MSYKPTIRILGMGITQRQVVLLVLIGILALHPFAFAAVSPEPYILALPWWYWADAVVLAVIYVLIQLYVRETVAVEEQLTEGDEPTATPGGEA